MNVEKSPFKPGWFSIELPGVRPCGGTYCLFPYETLPPVDESQFLDEFQWLPGLTDRVEAQMAIHRQQGAETRKRSRLDTLVEQADALNLLLPVSFLVFMGSTAMQEAIPSCTACYFSLGDKIIPSPFEDGGYFLRFLNDQQDVLIWYLYLTRDCDHCVVSLPLMLEAGLEGIELDLLQAHTLYSAPTFESFIYRFWLENAIWFADDEGRGLTPIEQRYLDHYRQ